MFRTICFIISYAFLLLPCLLAQMPTLTAVQVKEAGGKTAVDAANAELNAWKTENGCNSEKYSDNRSFIGKTYESGAAEAKRFVNFAKKNQEINTFNAKKGNTYSLELNHMADWVRSFIKKFNHCFCRPLPECNSCAASSGPNLKNSKARRAII